MESVKYYKTLENGSVVVVEKENSADGLGTINMWASLSNVAYDKLKRPSRLSHVSTSEIVTISDSDIAKIHKDAENAIRKDVALKGADVFIEEWGGKATKMKSPDSKTAIFPLTS